MCFLQNGSGRGAIVISHLFISSAFIYLAAQQAGCEDSTTREVDTTCEKNVYGLRPSSLVAIIATLSGVLAALFMPIIGAIIDYTPHRRLVGISSATLIWGIQFVQIWTNSQTWFAMLILQVINGFIYQVQFISTFAYFPNVADIVGEQTMNNFLAKFRMIQFGSMLVFLLLVILFSMVVPNITDVITSMISQTLSAIWIGICFLVGWFTLPDVPRRHTLGTEQSLLTAGFLQTWHTTRRIVREYGKSLQWYFFAVIFAEAGANAFTSLSVTYMNVVLQMSSQQIGVQYLIVLLCTIPGSKLGEFVSNRLNPSISFRLCLTFFSLVTAIAALVLTGPTMQVVCYIFGIFWGISLGWYVLFHIIFSYFLFPWSHFFFLLYKRKLNHRFYPTEEIMLTMMCPVGQEAELSGFFVFSTNILVWLPPLIFTIMNQSGINMRWGLMSLVIFFVIAIGLLSLMDKWEKVSSERKTDAITKDGNFIEEKDTSAIHATHPTLSG